MEARTPNLMSRNFFFVAISTASIARDAPTLMLACTPNTSWVAQTPPGAKHVSFA